MTTTYRAQKLIVKDGHHRACTPWHRALCLQDSDPNGWHMGQFI
jgi:hypothetical protein